MGKMDKLRPDEPTPAECMRKAMGLREMGKMLSPGTARDRALQMAAVWEDRARRAIGGDEAT